MFDVIFPVVCVSLGALFVYAGAKVKYLRQRLHLYAELEDLMEEEELLQLHRAAIDKAYIEMIPGDLAGNLSLWFCDEEQLSPGWLGTLYAHVQAGEVKAASLFNELPEPLQTEAIACATKEAELANEIDRVCYELNHLTVWDVFFGRVKEVK